MSATTLLASLFANIANAGVVRTATGTFEGKVAFTSAFVAVGAKDVSWSDVLYLNTGAASRISGKQRIILRNSESWPVDLLQCKDDKVTVRSDWFGEKQIDLGSIAEIDFVPQTKRESLRKPGTLYRSKGSPVPGKLLAIDKDTINVETILGAINLPRNELDCFFFADALPRAQPGSDEVALVDGTLMRGQLSLDAKGLKLKHAIFGEVSVPLAALASVVRHADGIIDVTELPLQSVQTLPLIGSVSEDAARYQLVREQAKALYCKGLRIEPQTTARFRPAAATPGKAELRLEVQSLPDARGDSRLRIHNGAKVVWEKEVSAEAPALAVAVEIHANDELVFEVDFGASLRFPCGVILGDPHVLLKR